MNIALWHAGIAVENLEQSIKTWEALGFTVAQKFEKDEPAAHAALMVGPDKKGVELWQFTGDSQLNKFVGRHIAFKCDDIQETAQFLTQRGFMEVIPFTKGVMVDYIFLKDQFDTYFELAQVREGKWDG